MMATTFSVLKRYTGYAILILSTAIVSLTVAHFPGQVDSVSSENPLLARADYKSFHGANYYGTRDFASATVAPDQGLAFGDQGDLIADFVHRYGLERAHILEVGAGMGHLQDVVPDYTVLDIAAEVGRFFHKPFVAASATAMPFKDDEFDAIWTIGVLQSVPMPEQALNEIRRVLKNGGLLLLQSGWQCRSWAAEGYDVRPYSDFGIAGKLIKASIPLRESVLYRALYTFPIRLLRFAAAITTAKPTSFRYTALSPNYSDNWQPESSAVNSMDPYEAILWFASRGDEVLSYDGMISPLLVRTGAIVIKINKPVK